jgi:hypothetical protein
VKGTIYYRLCSVLWIEHSRNSRCCINNQSWALSNLTQYLGPCFIDLLFVLQRSCIIMHFPSPVHIKASAACKGSTLILTTTVRLCVSVLRYTVNILSGFTNEIYTWPLKCYLFPKICVGCKGMYFFVAFSPLPHKLNACENCNGRVREWIAGRYENLFLILFAQAVQI